VLNYSVGEKALFPRPLADAALAMAHIKAHAEEYHIDPERVFCVGFSAGGHLSASLGTLWHLKEAQEMSGVSAEVVKPRGMVLCYPVLTAFEKAHKGSFYNILGTTAPTDEQLEKYSIEKQVDERTVPAFMMHTANDQAVPVENVLYMAEAMSEKKIPFELHIYPDAPHGVALGTWQTSRGEKKHENAAIARWVDDAVFWMRNV